MALLTTSLLAATLALSLVLAASAAADRPAHLDDFAETAQSQSSTHFKMHYDSTETSHSFVQEGLDDFETYYSRLVAGAGGSPNLGFAAPVSDAGDPTNTIRDEDSDGLIDVYITETSGSGGRAGCDGREQNGGNSGWISMDPSLKGESFRFRAAHELMHVVQCAYVSRYDLFDTAYYMTGRSARGFLTESVASWAAEKVGPVNPLDNDFRRRGGMSIPLDCTYREWKGEQCSQGYGRWLFLQHLTERYGNGLIVDAMERLDDMCPPRCNDSTGDHGVPHFEALVDELEQRSGGAGVGEHFRDYAHDVWDPTVWETGAVEEIYENRRLGARTPLSASEPDSGWKGHAVDHLAAAFEDALPLLRAAWVEVTVSVPSQVGAPPTILRGSPGGAMERVAMGSPISSGDGNRTYRAVVPTDMGELIIVPLVNDTDQDDLGFAFRARLTDPPSATRQPALARAGGVVPVRGRFARARLKCPSSQPCHGRVKLIARIVVRRVVTRGNRRFVVRRARPAVVGTALTQVPPSRAKAQTIVLNRRGRRLVRQAARAGRRVLPAKLAGAALRNRMVRLWVVGSR